MRTPLLEVASKRKLSHFILRVAAPIAIQMLSGEPALAQADSSCLTQFNALTAATSKADSDDTRKNLAQCAWRVDDSVRALRLKKTEPEALRLARMFFDVPEYHDEGRLAVNREIPGEELGPLAGIYASPFLLGFKRPSQIYEQGIPGTVVGIIVVDGDSNTTLPPSYQRLKLHTGLNCVWLYVDPPPPGMNPGVYLSHLHYTASVSHPPESLGCERSFPREILNVVAVKSSQFGNDSVYPPVARFDVDKGGRPIFGFRCLNAFCEIGVDQPQDVRTPDNLHRNDPNKADWNPHGTAAVKPGEGEREVIKGWHDEQALAVRYPDSHWHASRVSAWIRPEPRAANYDSADFEPDWRTVATIELANDIPAQASQGHKYALWGLRKGENKLQFRYDVDQHKWRARIITQASDTVEWHTMIRVVHHDVAVPATVRFRWTVEDDGVWAPCGNACCKASDGW